MIKLKLFGQPTSTFEYVKMRIAEDTNRAGIEISIQEITDIESFIREGIISVPTIKVNNHFEIRYDDKKSINEFIRNTIQQILREENYGQMKKIIVPTDFSDTAHNAFDFAKHLADHFGGMIKAVHAYHPMAADIDGMTYIDPEIEITRRKQLSDFVDSVNKEWVGEKKSRAFVEKEFLTGFASDEIRKMTHGGMYDYVVIGSTGSSGSFKKLFGSVSTEVVAASKCPVFVVPPNVKFKPFKNILYASDDPRLDSIVLRFVAQIGESFDAVIHPVHVKDDDTTYPDYDILELMKERYPKAKLQEAIIYHEDIKEALNEYIENENIDLLVMATKRRSLWNNLFHTSMTKRMAMNTKIPLLVYHQDDVVKN